MYFSFHYLAIQALRAGVMASDMVKVVCNVYLVLEMLLKLAAR